MKLSTWAKKEGLTYQTAWNLFKAGKLPVEVKQLQSGTILVNEDKKITEERNVIYCRVSNHSRKEELNYQIDRCKSFCNGAGIIISDIYKEIASGMNDSRKVLWSLLETNPTKIIVENKDRLTRFGFEYLKRLLAKQGCEVIVINESEEDNADLLKDLTSVIYSFCARLYGMRRAKNKADKCNKIINDEIE